MDASNMHIAELNIGRLLYPLEDPRLADCHYNLALIYEATGNQRGAIRHMAEYRRLARPNGT